MSDLESKVTVGGFKNEQARKLHAGVMDLINEMSEEGTLHYVVIVGVLENVKHSVQHRFELVPASQVDHGI